MTTKEVIQIVLEAAKNDMYAAIPVLEDGAALAELGITDDDQEAVECAHAELSEKLSE